MKKKTVSVSVSKERKNHKKFQLLDKILPSESSLKNFYLDAVPFVPIFFQKKKKEFRVTTNLTSRKKNEKRFVFAEFSKDSSHSSLPAMQHRPTKAGLVSGFNDDRDWVTIGGHETCK